MLVYTSKILYHASEDVDGVNQSFEATLMKGKTEDMEFKLC